MNRVCRDDSQQSNAIDVLKKFNLPTYLASVQNINGSINDSGDFNSDCSTIKDPESFIDQSFYDTRKSSSNNSLLQTQTTDYSTPMKSYRSKLNLNITTDESFTLEEKIETEFVTLNAKILEQTQTIYKIEQNLNSLTNENLHLKSRIDKLENKLCHKITPTIPKKSQKM